MKKTLLCLSLLLAFSFSLLGQNIDLNGTWDINREKSQLAEQFSMAPAKIEIKVDGTNYSETRHVVFQGEEYSFTDTFTLDGTECENEGWRGTIKKSVATWSEDRQVLTIVTKIPMGDAGVMTNTLDYKLVDGDLVIHSTASSSYGEMSENMVFTRE